MNPIKRITKWLEKNACAPAYSGWVLTGISICFFGAAVNTMAGWLYVISGVSLALLSVAAILPPRSLVNLTVRRRPIAPVTAGDDLVVELEIINQSKQSVSLLKVEDILPLVLKQKNNQKLVEQSIDAIAPKNSYLWRYYYPAERRGVYRWQTVELKSGAPLGLFWCRRSRQCPAKAIVYPQVLPLVSCPLIDEIGRDESRKNEPQGNPNTSATEGTVRSLRPYRIGDPIRLVHWRTSARRGELRVREFEMVTGGQDIIIALDSAIGWNEENFEQAVISATSLYFYAQRQQMNVQLWTAGTGLVRGERAVLETLAATTPLEDAVTSNIPNSPMIWLTENPLFIVSLPIGSRWGLWQIPSSHREVINRDAPGLILHQDEQLQLQLQKPLNSLLVNNFS
jgi:uncharacterized protein (DUF58 family)